MEMAKLAREDEVFIIDEEVERGCICTVFTIPRCTHVAKKSTSADVLWKKRKVVKFYSICVVIIILEVLRFPRPVNLYGLNKKRLFSFSSLLFLETCSKYQFCNFKMN